MGKGYVNYSNNASYNLANLRADNMKAIASIMREVATPRGVKLITSERSITYKGRDQTIKIDCYNTVFLDSHERGKQVKSEKHPFNKRDEACAMVQEYLKGMYESCKATSNESSRQEASTEA